MAINSKQKGKDGELEFANKCKEYGFPNVRRTAQYNGKELESKADVVGLPYLHVEVKRVEALNIDAAMEQAIRDNAGKDMPIVVHRKNGKKWKVTMELDTFMEIYKSYLDEK